MIVVIDTNVWISALQFAKRRGTPTLALEKAMSQDVIATCDEIDAEIVRVLTEKFAWERHRATSELEAVLAPARIDDSIGCESNLPCWNFQCAHVVGVQIVNSQPEIEISFGWHSERQRDTYPCLANLCVILRVDLQRH